MRVISQSPDPLARRHTMTERKGKPGTIDVTALLAGTRSSCGRWCERPCRRSWKSRWPRRWGREGRADAGSAGLPLRLLRADADHPDRQARAARPAGSRRTVLDRTVRTLSARRAGVGGGAGGDIRAGVSTRRNLPRRRPGSSDHRGTLRPQFFGGVDQRDQSAAG